jgi:hypothetical protein
VNFNTVSRIKKFLSRSTQESGFQIKKEDEKRKKRKGKKKKTKKERKRSRATKQLQTKLKRVKTHHSGFKALFHGFF